MNGAIPTVTFQSVVLNPNLKTLIPPNSVPTSIAVHNLSTRKIVLSLTNKTPAKSSITKRSFQVRASVESNGETRKWVSWIPTGGLAADKVLRLISTATASPICQFISSPTTFLHSVDPRIKLVWMMIC
ncbi:hypothetical protein SLEP1_g43625 [Rubroshorea leprosula]|uniref:MSP domain-containing protein n=1 Tax=Rubroshorea leprosula TaxID=152421 RepID=A0AAV5LDK5_9ROSI|nr:hypothetical protein SLEP1_g43625 [Rubroshorea leprosula]